MRFLRSARPAALALLVAVALIPAGTSVASADSPYDTNCPANLRSSPSIAAPTLTTLQTGTYITASGTVPGDPWSVTCPGSISGSDWFVVTSVNGTSSQTLYGVPAVYAATGLFRPATYLEGIDVSTYQGTIDWPSVAAVGKRFAIMRASLGTTYTDPTYPTNHASAKAAGLAVAAYHYATPSSDPNDAMNEANWFVANAGLTVGDMIPALDLEQSGGLGPADLQVWVQTWLDQVYAQTGVRAMIYTSPNFWSSGMAGTSQFANEGYAVLWVAHWGVLNPTVPGATWGGNDWTFWQYDNSGSVSGISGRVDLDRFNGLDLSRVFITSITMPPPLPAASPVLSAVAPSSVTAGVGDLALSLQGANFAPGASIAYWNGTPLGTTFVSASQLTASVPATLTSAPGTAAVTVVNQTTGGASAPTSFTVTLLPAQLTLSPSASVVILGQPVTLNVGLAPTGPGRTVTLQHLQAGDSDWSDVATQVTDDVGNAAFTYAPQVNTQFRPAFAGASDLGPGTSAPARVLVRSTVTLRPTYLGKVASITYGTRVTFTATAGPTGAGVAPQLVSFAFWRYVGGKWVYLTKRNAWVDATGRAAFTWTFNWRGQWYVRAVANSTATNVNSYWTPVVRYSVR